MQCYREATCLTVLEVACSSLQQRTKQVSTSKLVQTKVTPNKHNAYNNQQPYSEFQFYLYFDYIEYDEYKFHLKHQCSLI